MSWVAGTDILTGSLVTSAQWNNYMGAAGSLEYLKTEADKHDDISWAEPTRVLGTIYQNTGGKLRFVVVSLGGNTTNGQGIIVASYIGSTSPPTTPVGYWYSSHNDAAATMSIHGQVSFFVPINYYYKIDGAAGNPDATLDEWHEWDLL